MLKYAIFKEIFRTSWVFSEGRVVLLIPCRPWSGRRRVGAPAVLQSVIRVLSKQLIRATPSDGVNFIPYMKLLGVE
jgi:hypothetical protein